MATVIIQPRIGLLDQNSARRTIPNSCPRLICPTETKMEIWLLAPQNLLKWSFQDAPSSEPVMVVAKRLYPIFASEICLSFACFRNSKVVETQIRRQVGLLMPRE